MDNCDHSDLIDAIVSLGDRIRAIEIAQQIHVMTLHAHPPIADEFADNMRSMADSLDVQDSIRRYWRTLADLAQGDLDATVHGVTQRSILHSQDPETSLSRLRLIQGGLSNHQAPADEEGPLSDG